MKGAIAICFLGLVAAALARPGDDHYTEKFDNINLDEILQNDKLLDQYVKCIVDLGKCTAEGKELKTNIPDALENGCSKCTKAQHDGVKKVLSYLINHKKEAWEQVSQKHDPTGKYKSKYEKEYLEIAH